MKYLATLFLILGFGLSAFGQTIKSLGYNTTNGQVVYSGTNTLTFPTIINVEELAYSGDVAIQLVNRELISEGQAVLAWGSSYVEFSQPITFAGTNAAPASRANLGFSTNLNTLWTAANASNARTAVGLGETNIVQFTEILIVNGKINYGGASPNGLRFFDGTNNSAIKIVGDTAIGKFNGSFDGSLNVGTGSSIVFDASSLGMFFNDANARRVTITNLGLGWSALTNTNAATSLLGFTTNGLVVANTGTNNLKFTNIIYFGQDTSIGGDAGEFRYGGILRFELETMLFETGLSFNGTAGDDTRANLGFSTNLNTLWTATNASNARSAIGLGNTNAVAFSGFYNSGDLTNINGTIYGLKTNVGPFEGIGNFFASNNTTVSNETLFRVGLAEATNKSAQFGFRVTRTNNGGEGVAVYSVFGYNALMMIGPSDRSRTNYATNTNAGIEATLWTITPTNQVMTLRDTNTGATTLHQSLGFDTNVTSTAPADTTNIVKWIEVWVGTNSYRMPLYQ